MLSKKVNLRLFLDIFIIEIRCPGTPVTSATDGAGHPGKTGISVDDVPARMPTVTVEGMSCDHCEQTVEDAVRALSGVTAATADSETDQLTVEGEVDLDAVARAVEDAGYTAP